MIILKFPFRKKNKDKKLTTLTHVETFYKDWSTLQNFNNVGNVWVSLFNRLCGTFPGNIPNILTSKQFVLILHAMTFWIVSLDVHEELTHDYKSVPFSL